MWLIEEEKHTGTRWVRAWFAAVALPVIALAGFLIGTGGGSGKADVKTVAQVSPAWTQTQTQTQTQTRTVTTPRRTVVRTVTAKDTVTVPSAPPAPQTPAPATASPPGQQSESVSSNDPNADCTDKGTCPLTLARAHSVAVGMAAQIAEGSRSGVTGCTQQSPRKVSCDYWINSGRGDYACHYVATLTIIQPTYQRALQFEKGVGGTCE